LCLVVECLSDCNKAELEATIEGYARTRATGSKDWAIIKPDGDV